MTLALRRPESQRGARLRLWAVACGVAVVTALVARWAIDEWISVVLAVMVGAAYAWRGIAVAREREVLHGAMDAMQAGVVLYDRSDRLLLANADFRRLYDVPGVNVDRGMSFESLLRTRVQAGLVPEATGREEGWIAERIAQHRDEVGRSFLREMADGRWRRITEQCLPDGSRLGFSIDVTELVEQRQAADAARLDAQRTHALLDDAVAALPEGFALYDAEDRLVVCNQRYRQLYRESAPAMLPGATFESILRHGLAAGQYPQAAADPEGWLAERMRRHRTPGDAPILQELPGNRWLRIDERRTREGGFAGVRTDVTEMVRTRQALEASQAEAAAAAAALKLANAELERLSMTDALTGLANRRAFDQRLADEVSRARRHGTKLALLVADIDHFKRYNDLHGHPQGDVALRTVAAVLARQARRGGEMVARLGGEEFALLAPGTDAQGAERLAQRCVQAIAAEALPHGGSPTADHVTLSMGWALLGAVDSAASLLKRADQALYAAKAAGRARAVGAAEAAAQ